MSTTSVVSVLPALVGPPALPTGQWNLMVRSFFTFNRQLLKPGEYLQEQRNQEENSAYLIHSNVDGFLLV